MMTINNMTDLLYSMNDDDFNKLGINRNEFTQEYDHNKWELISSDRYSFEQINNGTAIKKILKKYFNNEYIKDIDQCDFISIVNTINKIIQSYRKDSNQKDDELIRDILYSKLKVKKTIKEIHFRQLLKPRIIIDIFAIIYIIMVLIILFKQKKTLFILIFLIMIFGTIITVIEKAKNVNIDNDLNEFTYLRHMIVLSYLYCNK